MKKAVIVGGSNGIGLAIAKDLISRGYHACILDRQAPAENAFPDADSFTFELEAGINKIRIYIWLEGQDADCINNISFGDFTTNLAFSVPEAE